MASDDKSDFITMIQDVGATLLDTQVKRIGKVYKVPQSLHDSDGERLLEVLHRDGKVIPSNVDELRRQLKRNFAGEAVKILDEYSGGPPALTELYNDATCVQTFIFRKEMADKLSKVVEPPIGKDKGTRYYSLVGEGGSGKTQMSLWFCEQMKGSDLYDVIWFMSGDGLEKFTEDLEDLMDELEIEYQGIPPKKLKRLLSKELNRRGRWLLVVDNFEGMPLREIEMRIPERGGTVLLTSRDRKILPVKNIVEVKPFSDEEAMSLFENILGEGNIEESLVREVGELLGQNAFALSICAYYLHESTVYTSTTALVIVRDKFHDLIGKMKDKKKGETVQEMYEHSLQKLDEKSPESWRMMKILSLLSADGVSREVVRKILKGKVLEEEMVKVKEIKELMSSGKLEEAMTLAMGISNASVPLPLPPTDTCEEYTTRESELVIEILRLGLAEKRGDKYYVHRLMMKVVQERMKKSTGEFTSVLEEVIEDMSRMWIEDDRDHTQWKKKQEMGEHVVSLAINEKHLSSTKSREQLVWMLYDYSFYTIEVKGDYTAAEERITKAEQVEGGGKCSKVVRAALKSVRGRLRASQGKYTEAITEYREGLEMEEEESRKAVYHNSLGICLRNLKKYPEALEEYEKSLEIDMKYKGENSIDVSNTLDNMGNCLSLMGSYEEALEKHRRALEICLDKYGEVNPLVASSYHNIGNCYSNMEKYEDALEKYEKALEIYRQVYGEEYHPDVAISLHNVGISKRCLGRVEEAKPHLEEAYRIRKRMLGEEHPDTVETKSVLDEEFL